MNNNNIVKIGTALKWCNTFDPAKQYYQENIITACGCVFRCKVLQTKGKSPVEIIDEQGHIAFSNTDIWDVIVDMAYYYNYAIDNQFHTQETLEYIKKLDEACKKQQEDIEAVQKDNIDLANSINTITRHIEVNDAANAKAFKKNDEEHRLINERLDKYDEQLELIDQKLDQLQNNNSSWGKPESCIDGGIWHNDLCWSETQLWFNTPESFAESGINNIEQTLQLLTERIEALEKGTGGGGSAFEHMTEEEAAELVETIFNDTIEGDESTLESMTLLEAE